MKYNRIKALLTVGFTSSVLALSSITVSPVFAAQANVASETSTASETSVKTEDAEETANDETTEETEKTGSDDSITVDEDGVAVKEVYFSDEVSEQTVTMPSVSRVGYKFTGWKHGNDLYDIGEEVTVDSDDSLDFVAQWESYKLTLNGQGANIKDDSSSIEITNDPNESYIYNVRLPRLASDGKTFKEWNTEPDGSGTSYSAGDHVRVDQDLTLYAIFEDKEVNIDPNGGKLGDSSETVETKDIELDDVADKVEEVKPDTEEIEEVKSNTEETKSDTEEAKSDTEEAKSDTNNESTESEEKEVTTKSSENSTENQTSAAKAISISLDEDAEESTGSAENTESTESTESTENIESSESEQNDTDEQ